MIEILVCYVVFLGQVAAPVETETCYVEPTVRTVEEFCGWAGGIALANGKRLSYCKPARGRMHP